MTEKVRFPGVDLAKIIAIWLVIVVHISGSISISASSFGITWFNSIFLSVSMSCIDLFAIATGFLCITSSCRYSRLLSLWVTTVFWGVVMLFFAHFAIGLEIPIRAWVKATLPILGDQYWFFTAYFMLFLFMPLLNNGLTTLDKSEYRRLLIALTIFICGYSCVGFGGDRFSMSAGYSFPWLAIAYVFGAYIRLYWFGKHSFHWYFAIAFAIALLPCVRQFLSILVGFRIPGDRFCLVSYTSPFTFAVAIFLLLGSLRVQIKNEKLCCALKMMSSCTFGIYLIHVQPYIFGVWRTEWHKVQVTNGWTLLAVILGGSIALFVGLCLIEFVRIKLFTILGIEKLIARFDKLLPRT